MRTKIRFCAIRSEIINSSFEKLCVSPANFRLHFSFTADEPREAACVSGAEVQVERRRIHPRAVRARGGAALGERSAPLRLCGLVVAAGTLERRTHMTPLERFIRSKSRAVPRTQPRMSRDPVSMFSRSAHVPALPRPVRIRCRGCRFFP